MHKQNKRGLLLTLAFLSVVPAAAHLAYSWMGFSPTDDGFTLAYSRRLLEGQVPHLDFIIIRPPLSPLLHAPFVLLGGEYMYWISRLFVWFEFAVMAWAWVSAAGHVFERASGRSFGATVKVLLGLVAFAASAQHFVITAWHTIDGLFLASIGAWLLVSRQGSGGRAPGYLGYLGYLLIGAAYLVKQSFIFMPPLFLLALGDWRRARYWIASAIPGLLYLAYLLATGALPDAFEQLTSQTSVVSAGVISYLNYAVVLGLIIGAASTLLIVAGHRLPGRGGDAGSPRLPETAGALALAGLPIGVTAVGMVLDSLSTIAFGIFGMLLGVVVVTLGPALYRGGWRLRENVDPARLAILALILGWSSSLSFGYNTPSLALGPMIVALAAFAYPTLVPAPHRGGAASHASRSRLARGLLIAVALALVISFGWSRTYYIYRQPSAGELTKPAGEVLPGGRLIYTDGPTHEFLREIREGRRMAERRGKEYAIVPQAAGYWPQAEQPNPLPIDWPWSVELATPELRDRVKDDLEAGRGETIVLAQKVDAFELSFGPEPATGEMYEVLRYVRENWEKTGETRYFEIYE
ncbi:hypothetical protein [Rubrobacter aplysinae]|uniref:hypothetical protein n=1 Tax=Rubrobacter aplysinae TaxID=909625 RepID=UPI00064C17F5|nr:hypothetical protein [Rubrobacter aplysinae]